MAFDYSPATVLKAAFNKGLEAELWFELSGSGQISVKESLQRSPELYWLLNGLIFLYSQEYLFKWPNILECFKI